MNIVVNYNKRGISLRFLNFFMLVTAVFVSVVLFFSMRKTNKLYEESHIITRNLVEWRDDSSELRTASDYLTEEIRVFVVTGDKVHLDNYFTEANVTQRREKALNLLRANHEDSDSMHELSEAMSESKQLMNTEYYAAKLAIEGYGYSLNDYPEVVQLVELRPEDEALSSEQKKAMAINYLFNEDYVKSKQIIYENIDECLKLLNQEVNEKQKDVAGRLNRQIFDEHVLTMILIGILLTIVILTTVLVFRPLRDCVYYIRNDKEVPLKGAYEVRFLAKNYNLMYNTAKQNEDKLNYEANHDKLTGLINRRGYDFYMNNVDMETSTLMIIDLDKFKNINDTYGHDVGDKVINRAALTIKNSFRDQDYVCRIGGDEFAVIMIKSNPSMKNLIEGKINRINEKLSKEGEDGEPGVSCSVGVAFGRNGLSVSDLFKNADKALYNAKEGGRNQVCFYKKK